jgi:hypothetical protein
MKRTRMSKVNNKLDFYLLIKALIRKVKKVFKGILRMFIEASHDFPIPNQFPFLLHLLQDFHRLSTEVT